MTGENAEEVIGQVLASVRRRRSQGGWPICLYLPDPPGKALIQAYVRQQASAEQILYLEIPPTASQKRNETYLPTLFLKALGDKDAEARDDAESKKMKLELLIGQREVNLIALVDFHHLVTQARKLPLVYKTTWIKALIKELYPPVPVIVTGDLERVESILCSNQQMESLFSRLLLPG